MKFKKLLISILISLIIIVTMGSAQERATAEVSMSTEPSPSKSAAENDSVEIKWDVSYYDFTCLNYNLQIVPVDGGIKTIASYPVNDIKPGEHVPLVNSATWVVPENATSGKYFAQIQFNTEEARGIQHYVGTAFVVSPGGTLKIHKFHDLNGNGIHNSDEPSLSGWEFTIQGPMGKAIEEYTDKKGEITVEKLIPGDYSIEETLPSGWVASTPHIQNAVIAEEDTSEVYFGNYIPPELNIWKFDDRNWNKMHDSGETFLSGWEFDIEGPNNYQETLKTDANGAIKLRNLEPGRYDISERSKSGSEWIATTPTEKSVVLESGDKKEVLFGNAKYTPFDVVIYHDINENGRYESNVDLDLEWTPQISGPPMWNGHLRPGDYVVSVPPLGGWISTTPVEQTATLKAGVPAVLYFGFAKKSFVIVKFEDCNKNGVQDSDETGVENWEFIIEGPNGVETKHTDEDGNIKLDRMPVGDYMVTESLNPNWYNTTPIKQKVALKLGDISAKKLSFGNTQDILEISKFEDHNGNGVHDSDEPGLSGWEFTIQGPNGVETKLTDGDGLIKYVYAPGTYTIKENLEERSEIWYNTSPSIRKVALNSGYKKLEFGNDRWRKLTIYKFNDANQNMVSDSDEMGIGGWEFLIKDNKTGLKKRVITGENGFAPYKLKSNREYVVSETTQLRWKNTTPIRREIWVNSTEYNFEEEFGNFQKPPTCPCEAIYEPDLPPWGDHDENLNVTKSIDPYKLNYAAMDLCYGTEINYNLTVCVVPKMKPTDLVLAVDTSGSMVAKGYGPLEDLGNEIVEFVKSEKNNADLRIGMVSWDEDIDNSVSLSANSYGDVIDAANSLRGNIEEFTYYQVGLNGALNLFKGAPSDSDKIIVFITDATGNYKPIIKYPDLLDYTVHAIVISPTTEIDELRKNNLMRISEPTGGELKIVGNMSDISTMLSELVRLQLTTTNRTLENVRITDSLPNYLHLSPHNDGNFTVNPDRIYENGTQWKSTTMEWDVGTMASGECWTTSFDVLFCWRFPADARRSEDAVTSEISYTDPKTGDKRQLFIPEGGIWTAPEGPVEMPVSNQGSDKGIPGFEAPLAVLALFAVRCFFMGI